MASSHGSTLAECICPRRGSMTAQKVEHAHELEEASIEPPAREGEGMLALSKNYPFGMQDIADI